jgi:hypothetical protein
MVRIFIDIMEPCLAHGIFPPMGGMIPENGMEQPRLFTQRIHYPDIPEDSRKWSGR